MNEPCTPSSLFSPVSQSPLSSTHSPSAVQWRQVKYEQVFDDEVRGLTRRRAADADFSVEDVRQVLKQLYIMDGADWGGRGDLQDTIMAARIAAHEHFVAQWQAEGSV
jgi:hypothetical protein